MGRSGSATAARSSTSKFSARRSTAASSSTSVLYSMKPVTSSGWS